MFKLEMIKAIKTITGEEIGCNATGIDAMLYNMDTVVFGHKGEWFVLQQGRVTASYLCVDNGIPPKGLEEYLKAVQALRQLRAEEKLARSVVRAFGGFVATEVGNPPLLHDLKVGDTVVYQCERTAIVRSVMFDNQDKTVRVVAGNSRLWYRQDGFRYDHPKEPNYSIVKVIKAK